MENSSTQFVDGKYKDLVARFSSSVHLVILVLITISTRIGLLNRRYPLSFDDGVYFMSVKHISKGSSPFSDVFSSQGPYFLPILSVPSHLFGFHPWSVRFVPLVAGIVAVVLTYQISRRFLSSNWAFLAAFLVGVSGTFLRATTPITSDGVLSAVVLLVVFSAYKFLDIPKMVYAVFLGISIGIGAGIKSIFMIPVLIFVVLCTWKTSIRLRLLAGCTSIVIFLIPFFLYGLKDTLDQSILYHLGKNDKLNIGSNLSKIFTTLSSFDLALFILAIAGFFVTLIYILQNIISDFNRMEVIRKRIFNNSKPYLFIITLTCLTLILSALQNPLFRNHLAALIAPLSISSVWIASRVYEKWGFKFGIAKLKAVTIFSVIVVLLMSAYSLTRVYSDSLITDSPQRQGAVEALKILRGDSLILTNDPGLAFAANMDVPVGFEDTSRYRFISKNVDLVITRKRLETILVEDKTICAYAVAPLPISNEMKLRNLAPANWNQIFDDGYMIWLNPSKECLK